MKIRPVAACDYVGPPLRRIKATNERVTSSFEGLSSSALKLQIELRAGLLKDIEVIRTRLTALSGGICNCGFARRRRPCRHAQRSSPPKLRFEAGKSAASGV